MTHIRSYIPCPHLELYRTSKNCSGTVWIGAEPRPSIPVPERYQPTCPHYKLNRPNYTKTVCYGTSPTKYWVSDRNGTYGMSVTFIDVDRWSSTVPVPYRSKNASKDRIIDSSNALNRSLTMAQQSMQL